MTTLTLGAVEAIGASKKDGQRAKNMFALGLLSWMYGRELEHSEAFIREKFARKPDIAEANVLALKAGWNYGETTEAFATTYEVSPAKLKSGEYRQISGNTALAYGIVTAGRLAGIQVVLGSYPITPASDILHELSKHKNFNVTHLPGRGRDRRHRRGAGCVLRWRAGRHQHLGARPVAEDRGHRPGRDDRVAAARHRRAARRPVDRAADQDRAGRPAAGAVRPQRRIAGRGDRAAVALGLLRGCGRGRADRGHLPHTGDDAVRRRHRERLGAVAHSGRQHLPPIDPTFAKAGEPFQPYARDPETLARQFAIPGTPGLEHRIGGLEKANGTGNISYEPANHDLMVRLRQAKIDGIAVPDLEVDDPTGDAELLMVGWGSSYGPIGEACRRARREGIKVAHAQLRNLNPLPANLGEVLRRYPKVVAPEMNLGQLALLLRGRYLVDVQSVTKVEGMAFLADEVEGIIDAALDGTLGEKEIDKAKFARLAAATVETGVGANA